MERQQIEKQYDYIHDVISKKLEQQIGSLDAIDTKANILLVGIGALLAGYFQLVASGSFTIFRTYHILMLIEMLCFFASGFFVFRTFLLRSKPVHKKERWRNDPEPQKLLLLASKNYKKGEYWLKEKVIKSMADSYEYNKGLVERKYDNFRYAKMLIITGVIVLFVHIILAVYNVNHISFGIKG